MVADRFLILLGCWLRVVVVCYDVFWLGLLACFGADGYLVLVVYLFDLVWV